MNLFSNPWKVSNFEAFLFYCCPKCTYRCKNIVEFEQHVINVHLVQSDGNPQRINIKNDLDDDSLEERNVNKVMEEETIAENFNHVMKQEKFDGLYEEIDYHHSMVEVKIEDKHEVSDKNDYNYYEGEKENIGYLDQIDDSQDTKICKFDFSKWRSIPICRHKSVYQYALQYAQECPKVVSLKKHTTHNKFHNKYHKCESCGKSFSDVHDLKRHIHTIHEGNKKYKCESCGKSYSRAHHLKKHIKDNRKNFECEYCFK